jgi:ankyrin repeat protein
MIKQSYTANFCSPIHCASINSNTELLAYILKHISDLSIGDSLGRKPIHYAAVLESTKQLEMLVKAGADLKELDKKKCTPLMLAAKFGRQKNVKYILDKVRDPNYINFKGDDGLAAMHYAVIEKHHECISLMIEDNLV